MKVTKSEGTRIDVILEIATMSVTSDVEMRETKFETRTGRRCVKFAFESREMFERVEEMECFDGSEADLRESEGFELLSTRKNDSKEHEIVGHLGVLF